MDKKFYWIKLKTNFFNREDIDFILSQENGCEYIVLYQMLCLNTANTDGRLESQMNEVIIPYDIKKIVRDCKYFDYDTVAVALELFKKLGLIYEEEDRTLRIANYNEMVGSETSSAQRVREWRKKKMLQCNKNVINNVTQENRDKSIEYKSIDNKSVDVDNIYDYLEQNFARPLTPIEYEEIGMWVDNNLTRYAIKKAILNGKYSINYISKILYNYKQKNIITVQQAQQEEELFNKTKGRYKEPIPEHLNKEYEIEEATEEQQKEIEERINKVIGVKQ